MRVDTPLILPPSAELDRLVGELFDALEQRVEFDRVAFCRVSGANEVEVIAVRPEDQSDLFPNTRVPFADVLGADAVRAGLAVEVDLASSPLSFDRALVRAGFRHVLRVPIHGEGLAAAGIAVTRRTEPFAEADIATITALADAAAPPILALAHAAKGPATSQDP